MLVPHLVGPSFGSPFGLSFGPTFGPLFGSVFNPLATVWCLFWVREWKKDPPFERPAAGDHWSTGGYKLWVRAGTWCLLVPPLVPHLDPPIWANGFPLGPRL